MNRVELIKNIMLGALLGTIITLVCSLIRLKLDLEEAERLLDDPSIRFPNKERPMREYERADFPMRPFYELPRAKKKLNHMPIMPDIDYTLQ